jgi:hypothetical protein
MQVVFCLVNPLKAEKSIKMSRERKKMAYLWNIIVALSVILPLLGVADTHLPLLGAGSVVRRSVVVESLVDVDRLQLWPGDVIHLAVK